MVRARKEEVLGKGWYTQMASAEKRDEGRKKEWKNETKEEGKHERSNE